MISLKNYANLPDHHGRYQHQNTRKQKAKGNRLSGKTENQKLALLKNHDKNYREIL